MSLPVNTRSMTAFAKLVPTRPCMALCVGNGRPLAISDRMNAYSSLAFGLRLSAIGQNILFKISTR